MSIIICKHSRYQRTTSGKSWQQKPYDTKTFIMSESIFWQNFQQPDSFMKALGGTERIYKKSTFLGYVAQRVVCVAPDRQTKSERLFYIFKNEKDLQEHGDAEVKKCWEDKNWK